MSAPDRIWATIHNQTFWHRKPTAEAPEYLRADGPTITALLARIAAMEAQIKGLEGGIEAACDREAETERKLRTALAASETRAEAAEAELDALRAERDAVETERRRAVNEAETLRHYRKSHVDAEERLTAAEAQIAALTARVERLTGAGNNLVARLYQMWTEARDHRDRGDLGSAEYAKRDMAASAFRDAYLASRAILSATTEESK